MTVFQRLARIAKPYRGNLIAGLTLIFLSTFLETAVVTTLIATLVSLVASWDPNYHHSKVAPGIPEQHGALTDYLIQVKTQALQFISAHISITTPQEKLIVLAIATGLVVLLKCVFAGRAGYLMNRFANLMVRDLRQRLFKHLVHQPPAYFEHQTTGGQVTRITGDVVVLQQCMGPQLAQVLQAPLTIAISLSMMVFVSWRLMLTVLCIAPLIGLVMSAAGRRIRKISVTMQERLGDLNGGLIERLANIRVIQSFVRQSYEIERVQKLDLRYYRETMKSVLLAETLSPGVEFIAWFGMVIGIILGGMEVLRGSMSGQNFLLFMFLAQRAGSQFKQLSRINQLRQQANGAGDRIFATLDAQPEITDAPEAIALPPVQGHVVFEHVGFRYRSGGDILRDINLQVAPGEVIALVGPSGSGKTTLVNLLPRFYDPTAGRILVDGHELRQLTLDSLREQVGIVPQETLLFSGTIYDNIKYGKLDATEEEILAAAKSANALEFIERLPDGMHTLVGERGSRLSGGQRQRVAIARALLKNPRILVLDEATSALDTESEHLVQQALDRLMQNRTTFVIAHRLSTVKGATRLLVLDRGQIAEAGTHDELLALGGLYARLYEMQFRTGTPETAPMA